MTNIPNSELPQQTHVLPHRVPAKCLKACSAYPTRVQVSVVVSETHEIFQIRVTSTISTNPFYTTPIAHTAKLNSNFLVSLWKVTTHAMDMYNCCLNHLLISIENFSILGLKSTWILWTNDKIIRYIGTSDPAALYYSKEENEETQPWKMV
jgi:hypothetical protein